MRDTYRTKTQAQALITQAREMKVSTEEIRKLLAKRPNFYRPLRELLPEIRGVTTYEIRNDSGRGDVFVLWAAWFSLERAYEIAELFGLDTVDPIR